MVYQRLLRPAHGLCWVRGGSLILQAPHRGLKEGEHKQDKQHEMYMPNANPNLAYPMRTISHWLALGLALSVQGVALGVRGFALGPQVFLDINMLVYPT